MKTNSTLQNLLDKWHQHRVTFYWLVPTVLVVTYALMLCVPKFYKSTVLIKQEQMDVYTYGIMGQLLGLETGLYKQDNALTCYNIPDVVTSYDLLIQLFNTPVTTSNNAYQGTYYEYVLLHTKKPFWSKIISGIRNGQWPWKTITDAQLAAIRTESSVTNPTKINKSQEYVYKYLFKNIQCKTDQSSELITISVKDQDAQVAATIANRMCELLQVYFDNYRASKIEDNTRYYTQAIEQAHQQLEAASMACITYNRTHRGALTDKEQLEREQLTNAVQIAKDTYDSFVRQYRIVASQLIASPRQFAVIQSAYASHHAAGPHRTIITLLVTILVTLMAGLWIGKEEIYKEIQ